MKNLNRILWGIVFLAVGVFAVLKVCGVVLTGILFEGWWTLFIIVPCFIGIFTNKDKFGSLIGLLIGVFLLLCAQNILQYNMIWKLILPVIIIAIGLKLIFGGMFNKQNNSVEINFKNEKNTETYSSVFTGRDIDYTGKEFNGMDINTVFGGAKLDLTKALIKKDCVINANTVFGGIDIYVPEGINIKVVSNSFFGGVSNKKHFGFNENLFTVYINASCVFGGINII